MCKCKEIYTDLFTPAKSDIALHTYYTAGGSKQRKNFISDYDQDQDKDKDDNVKESHITTGEPKKSGGHRRLTNWRGILHKDTGWHDYIETANRKYRKYLLRWCKFDNPEEAKNDIDKIFAKVKDTSERTATDKQFEVFGRAYYGQRITDIATDLGVSKQSISERYDLIKKKLKANLPGTLNKLDKAIEKKREHIWKVAGSGNKDSRTAKRFLENNLYLQSQLK
jgi:hypothetical protein